MEYEQFIEQALKKASKIAIEQFGKVASTVKAEDPAQVLTKTDLAIGKLLIEEIQKNFSKHSIIDEEAGVIDNKSEYAWVVDPIDGTSNFAASVPTYGIMLGLLKNGISIAGGIALPQFDELLIAGKGTGALLNGKPVHVSKEERLLSSLISYGIDGNQQDPEETRKEAGLLGEIVLNVRNLRSSNSCFDFVMVAKGNYGACLGRKSRIWDHAAATIICTEAGGIYTDFSGKPLDFSDPITRVNENYDWCIAPPQLHTQLQKIIHENKFS